MMSLCHKQFYLQSRCLLNKSLFQEVKSNLKILSANKTNIRHYAKNVEENNKLERIYYGPLTPQIRAVKIFSITSSFAGLIAQPIIINETSKIGSTTLLVALSTVVGFFTFVTPLLLHFITKKYVTEIHYDPETSTYKATYINFFIAPVTFNAIATMVRGGLRNVCNKIHKLHLMFIPKHKIKEAPFVLAKFEFKAEDVVVPDIPGMFTTMIAKGKPVFIEARHFSDPMYYAKVMGYDKPLDFKLGNVEEENKK